MPHFVYQESKIWDGNGDVDRSGAVIKIKAKSLIKAKKQLPPNTGLGRTWVLISEEK